MPRSRAQPIGSVRGASASICSKDRLPKVDVKCTYRLRFFSAPSMVMWQESSDRCERISARSSVKVCCTAATQVSAHEPLNSYSGTYRVIENKSDRHSDTTDRKEARSERRHGNADEGITRGEPTQLGELRASLFTTMQGENMQRWQAK